MTKAEAPITSRELQNGNLRSRTIGKQIRVGQIEGALPMSPVQPEPNGGPIASFKFDMSSKFIFDFHNNFPELGPPSPSRIHIKRSPKREILSFEQLSRK